MRRLARRKGDRGFALLIVLWALVLLSLLFTQLVSAGRSETQLAANLRAGAKAEAAADATLYQAIFHLLDPSPAQWLADGRTYVLQLPDARASVSVVDLGGHVNPNTASAALLAALMRALGAERTTADAVAGAIVDWRSPDAQGTYQPARYAAAGLSYAPAKSAFQSLDEVGLVLGMSPGLLGLLAPHLSLANSDNPSAALADPMVLRAMKDIGIEATSTSKSGGIRNLTITAAVVDNSGARFVRQATVRLGAVAPYQILSWDSPAWP